MFLDFSSLFSFITMDSIGKVLMLIALGFYVAFALIVFNQVRSLNKIFFIASSYSSQIMYLIALIHLLAAISLFLLSLGIL